MKEFVEKLIEKLEELPTKAITRYKGGAFGDYEGTDYFIDKYKTKDIIKELAEEFATDINVVSKDGWIPCSERLPNVGITVLCYWKKNDRYNNTTSYYYTLMHRNEDYQWISDFGMCNGDVIAWQPLPEPYKEEGGENE